MMVKRVELEREDFSVGSGPVTLRIVIGDAQLGTSLVLLDGEEIASGSIALLRLPAPADLVGKRLTIVTTVTDVQRMTNRTSVTYVLTGGAGDWEYRSAESVDEENASVVYKATFDMKP